MIRFLPPTFQPWAKTADKTVAVLMSGGVDSSLSALFLKEAGWQVLGSTMKIPMPESCCSSTAPCCGADAAFVADELNIPHYYIDVDDLFEEKVIARFRKSYQHGHTPNPCIDCNTFLKFSAVWDLITAEFGIKHLATGHYARVKHDADQAFLMCGADQRKDQSYFLYGIRREKLPYLILPMGQHRKQETRRMAANSNISVAHKPESMELCFAGEGDYRGILESGCCSPGNLVDMEGKVLGEHCGICNFTIGQRRGLGVSSKEPLYVIRINAATNTVVVGSRDQAFAKNVDADQINVLIPELLQEGIQLFGKIRSYTPWGPCQVVACSQNKFSVQFERPQFAPAPGQSLVLYDQQGRVVAGGEISCKL